MELQNKLEELKQMGNYAVSLNYGEDVGCDDSDVPQKERRVIVIMAPVGCIGETRMMYYGKLKDFLEFNLKSKPEVLPNPPKNREYEKGGYFIWGIENSVERILNNPVHGEWE